MYKIPSNRNVVSSDLLYSIADYVWNIKPLELKYFINVLQKTIKNNMHHKRESLASCQSLECWE